MGKLAIVLLSFALVLTSASARGAGRRIALLHGDPELQRALALAFAAWDVETVPLDARLSEELDAAARMQAGELARSLHLEGVVWVSPSLQGSRLAVFDTHTGELTVRSLPELPPFASATAASLALSVKTALRPSVEPVSEQMREPPARRTPVPEHRRIASDVRESAPRRPRVSLRTMFDVAWLADKKLEPRWGLGTTLWLGPRRRWGIALRPSASSGAIVDAGAIEGRYRDLQLALRGEWRWLDADVVSSTLGLGAALRRATLDATLLDGSHMSVVRYNPSVDAGVRLDIQVAGPWFVAAEVSAVFFTQYQRFLVAERLVFAPFRLSPSAGASLGIALF